MSLSVDYTKLKRTTKQLVKAKYIKQQDGLCWYCHLPLEGPPSKAVGEKTINKRLFPEQFFKWPIHLHHDRKTNLTIGVVHAKCNAVLWQYHGQ